MIIFFFHSAHELHNFRQFSLADPFTILEPKSIIFIGSTKKHLISTTIELVILNFDYLWLVKCVLQHHLYGLLLGFDELLRINVLHHLLESSLRFLYITFLFLNDEAAFDEWEKLFTNR